MIFHCITQKRMKHNIYELLTSIIFHSRFLDVVTETTEKEIIDEGDTNVHSLMKDRYHGFASFGLYDLISRHPTICMVFFQPH